MLSGIGVYRGGTSGGYARVHVCCHDVAGALNVDLVLDDHDWNDQLRDGSFASWTDAAIVGVQYALNTVDQDCGNWIIHRIVGLMVDTNPRFVAIAAAKGAWIALQIEPSPSRLADLDQFASTRFAD